jgi:hypothetical protein
VDRDEVRPDDVPVHVLERQVQVVGRVQAQLEELDDPHSVFAVEAGSGVVDVC